MKKITVHIEWPTGSEDREFDMDDDSTEEDIFKACEEEFFNRCNFGFSVNGEVQ